MSQGVVSDRQGSLGVPDQGGHRPLTLNRASLRRDTPGCDRVAHLNNAGASFSPRQVVDRITTHLRLECEIGGYEAAAQVGDEWQSGRAAIAGLLGTAPRNLALVESSTVGFHRILSTLSFRRGDRVLLAGSEYASTVLPLLQLSRRIGLRVEFIPDGDDGSIDIRALERALDDDVRLVCAVHAPSHNGLVNDVSAVGAALARSGSPAWFVVDACQSVGQLDVSAHQFGCDFLVASGRKFLRGPRGTGMLVVSDRALSELDAYPVDVGGAEWVHSDDFRIDESAIRYESFERSVALNLGLMAAAEYALELTLPALTAAISRNAEYLRAHVGALHGWTVLDRGRNRSGIVALRHRSVPAGEVVATLKGADVNAWEISHTSNPRDLGLSPIVRLSPHAYNSQDELDRALTVLTGFPDAPGRK